MKLLNVVDLDRTLISIDSFRYLVLKNLNISLFVLIVLRRLGLISRDTLARKAAVNLSKILSDDGEMQKFVEHLVSKVNGEVLEKVNRNCGDDSVTVILSASPQEYVSRFAERYGFLGVGSHWDGLNYFHCHGSNKVKYLESRFARDEYIYNFAISDSKSDIDLLSLFRTGELFENEKSR